MRVSTLIHAGAMLFGGLAGLAGKGPFQSRWSSARAGGRAGGIGGATGGEVNDCGELSLHDAVMGTAHEEVQSRLQRIHLCFLKGGLQLR